MERPNLRVSWTPMVLSTLLFLSPVAQADADACVVAVATARSLEHSGRMLAAQLELSRCPTMACSRDRHAQCEARLVDLETRLPSVVVVVKDARGVDLPAAIGAVDGVAIAAPLGSELQLDPGPHRIVVRNGAAERVRDIVARVGDQRRRVEIVIAEGGGPSTALPPPIARHASDVNAAWVVAAVGLGIGGIGIAAGAITGALALERHNELESQCAGAGCTQDDIDAGTTLAHLSTGAFVVGGLGLAVGLAALWWPTGEEETISVAPLLAPGFVGIDARF